MGYFELIFCSRYAAKDKTDQQQKYWNVVSIGSDSIDKKGDSEGWPDLPGAKELIRVNFDDIVYVSTDKGGRTYNLVTPEKMEAIINQVRAWTKDGPAPVLVHCHASISRSTATTLVLLIDRYKDQPTPEMVVLALRELIAISSNIMPNPKVLEAGIEIIFKGDEAKQVEVIRAIYAHRIWKTIN